MIEAFDPVAAVAADQRSQARGTSIVHTPVAGIGHSSADPRPRVHRRPGATQAGAA